MIFVMNKTERLDLLFKDWKLNAECNNFKKDGIIWENKYLKLPKDKRILFLMKEGNDSKQEKKEGDYRSWWKEEPVEGAFSHRLSEWAYGLIEDFPPLISDVRIDFRDYLHKIAFMNLKKCAGGAKSDFHVMKEVVVQDREKIIREIEIIEPSIIVAGITWYSLFKALVGHEISWIQSGFDIEYFKWNVNTSLSIKVINYYHPSSRIARAMTYCLLGAVINSVNFKNL